MSSSPNTRTQQILPRDARDAIEAVFDALSKWRDEIGASTERYSETVLDKMADAARALGWPNELLTPRTSTSCRHQRRKCKPSIS